MAGSAVRFKNPFQSYNPATIFEVDQGTKTLKPFGSGPAYQQAGYQFGQERLVEDPNEFAGFSVGPIINDRAASLAAVKSELNNFQNSTFEEQAQANKRKSSTLEETIAAQTGNLSKAMEEFNALTEKYKTIQSPNYQQSYNDLRTQAGIPGLEQQYAGVRQTRRELPYTERAGSGNAAVMTEGQLGANIGQKDIPLGIQEQNTIDRLQLASDFVNQSLKFKELDVNTSRAALENAINLVTQSINMNRTALGDLKADKDQQQARQDQALQFRLENNITTPFFNTGGTIYDSGSLEGIPTEEEFEQKYGMKLPDAEARGLVGKLNGGAKEEKALVLDLASKYADAGIMTNDTLATAQSKIKNSGIYREQIRPPASAGGSGSGALGLSNQQIDNISPLVTQFQNSPIVQNYNTIGEGYNFAKSISTTTKNPADDQALIYAFAKAMDPGSVVREGEYATVQKYAQSWAQSYGKSFTQALNGTGFLSSDARSNIKATIESRFKSAENSYKNLFGETSRRINLVGGTNKGDQLLNNYGGAFAQPAGGNDIDSEIAEGQASGLISGGSQPQKQKSLLDKFINVFGF